MMPLMLALTLGQQASATEIGDRPFGLGVILGDPSGLSAKYYLGGRSTALDFALAFDTYGPTDGWMYFHGSYLIHPSVLGRGDGVEFPWHVGIGAFAMSGRFGNDVVDDLDFVGLRVPLGVDADLEAIPLQFFADLALRVSIIPGTDIDFDAGIGARYYF